ncbi:DUF3307 domain-containing protein [Natroniella sulfidigena]|uniref:DUF3307 domain-containing protein n=1 Tax=Natroniella sulfidigena TaxID=723921 RepID=UPI00200B3C91|nr:DUF3307 domain-containing protein [Natroniella sulfidigena]MCK8817146.1 DUF3307 domain-containing protein [Natroniella sulfidigena]
MGAKLIVSIFILAHIIADFIIQDDRLAKRKKKEPKSLLLHSFMVFITLFLFTSFYASQRLVIIQFLIAVSHLVIDYIKISIEDKVLHSGKNNLNWIKNIITDIRLFIIDQILHLIILIGTYTFLENIRLNFVGRYLNNKLIELFPILDQITVKDLYIIILVISGYVLVWKFGSILVRLTLDKFISKDNDIINANTDNPGELIGKLERLLILTLVLGRDYSAISLVFAAKSVARFNNFKDKDFVDYYIVGTLASVLIGIVIGLLLNLIIGLEGYDARFIFYDLIQ